MDAMFIQQLIQRNTEKFAQTLHFYRGIKAHCYLPLLKDTDIGRSNSDFVRVHHD